MITIKKKVCFIAQFPPPIHGLSKAVDTLYNSYLNKEFEFSKIDITNNKNIFKNLLKVIKNDSDVFYLTIAQSRIGNLRDLVFMKLLLLRKKKIIVHLHGGYYRNMLEKECGILQKKMNYSVFKQVYRVIILGKSLSNIFENIVESEKIHIVENCVDDEYMINDEKFERKISLLENKKTLNVLYLSNFMESKGYIDVLNIAKIIKERKIQNIKFTFAGKFFSEKSSSHFLNYINSNNLGEIVNYKGIVTGEEKTQLLYDSDVFILLTRNEGQPISIIEAMANGLTIMTTNVGGIPDLIKDKENGFFFDVNDYENIIKKLLELSANIKPSQEMCLLNREIIKKKFTQKSYIEKMGKIFRDV